MASRNIAWEIRLKKERIRRLLSFIAAERRHYYEGCPRLLLYGFIKKEGLSTAWLHTTLAELQRQQKIYEPLKGHYDVLVPV